MRKKCLAMLLAVVMAACLLPGTAFAAAANPGDTATKENVLEVLRQYDAGAYHIMKTEADRGFNFMVYFTGESIFSRIGTAVHETYHGYTKSQSNGIYTDRIYLGDGKSYDVDYSVAYTSGNFTKTEEMSKQIPAQLQTTRYNPYVVPGAREASNTLGVFGLLNEFTAYYWGLKTVNSLAQWLTDADAEPELWRTYVSDVGNNMTAYAEFKYWTLRYMLYIKSANPALYQTILSNENYCVAYQDAEAQFVSEIARSREILDNAAGYLSSKGCRVEWTDSYLYLRIGYSLGGAGLESYTALMAELEKAEYVEMDSVLKNAGSKPAQTPVGGTAYPSTQTVDLDGKTVTFQMYALKDENGNNTNYIKIRDLALALNGTRVQFNVGLVNGAANIETGKAYVPNGSENSTPFSGARAYTANVTSFNLDGEAIDLESIYLKDDNGGGYTYSQVKDLAMKLNFNARWDTARGIICIETDKPYTGN